MTIKESRIQHYSSSQKILLVGEGDFSFSACLARAFGSAANMIATSLDSEDTLLSKHQNCEENLDDLEERGCLVLHEVDVHDMNKHPKLKGMKYDVIIFNFPHAGHVSWLCETDPILIERHKNLLRAFFGSASGMLKEDGEVHVTHRDDYPYSEWEVEKQAQKAGLVLKEKVSFVKQNYPGYHNKRGGFINGNKRFPLEDPFTFKFSLDRLKTTFGSATVSCYNCNRRDMSSAIQSKKKLSTLEAELFPSSSNLSLVHQQSTLNSINGDKSFSLNDPPKISLDHDQGMTLTSTSNKNVTLNDPFISKVSLEHRETTLVRHKDPLTPNFSVDRDQGTTLMSTRNKNATLNDHFISKVSLDLDPLTPNFSVDRDQ